MSARWNGKWMLSAAAVALIAGQGIMAQPTPKQSLLALSKHDHTLAIVDPITLKVIARAPVGPDPHEVIASSDGKTAYVSIYGGGRYHALSVIDLVAQKALPDIDTGALNGPHGLAFVGGKLYFTAEGAKAIARFDPASAKIDWIMGTGQNRTHMVYVTPDENHIYTTNVSSATVTILEKVALPPMGPPPGAPPAAGIGGPPPGGPAPAARRAWTGTRPSSPSAKARRASTSRPMAANSGPPTLRTALSPSSTSPRRRSWPPLTPKSSERTVSSSPSMESTS